MRYGEFVDDGRAFEIRNPDTPRPWMNVLFNDEYGLFFSQTGLGYSFYKNVLAIPVTYVDVFTYVPQWPQTGKFVFLHDMESRAQWSIAPFFADQQQAGYRCLHEPGRSLIESTGEGIVSKLEIVVPPGADPVELWRVTLRNESNETRRIRFYPYHELRLASYGSGATDVFTYLLADYDPAAKALIAHNNNSVSKLQYGTFMIADYEPAGYDCRLESFVGNRGRVEAPVAVQNGACTNSRVSAERACNVLEGVAELRPGSEKTFHVLFGIGDTVSVINDYRKRYIEEGKPADTFRAVADYWGRHYRTLHAETPFAGFDALLNTWYKHGALLTSRFVRGGTKGYRDIVQDVMGMCPLEPDWTRRWLLESLRHMNHDGQVIRCFDTIAGRDDLRMHRDCGLWLPIAASEYLRETGDSAFLQEIIAYRDQGKDSVWQHMLRNIRFVASRRGSHNLCLIGDGDWNDSLDEINRTGHGESAWLTVACVNAIRLMEEIAAHCGDLDDAAMLPALRAELIEAVNAESWDGEWYVYGFADDGRPVGTRTDKEGRVHLNMQTWAIFSGVAQGERQESILRVIDEKIETHFGPLLIWPPYTHYDHRIGKMSAKNPGHCENGPIYSHGICFKMLADAVLGRGNEAMQSFTKLSPFNPCSSQDIYRGEPFAAQRYLVSNANPEQEGAGWYPYFTATPAWMLMVLNQWILGIRPWYSGLIIDPVIPEEWADFTVTRCWRGATYHVKVSNPDRVQCGVVSLSVDGRKIEGNRIPIAADGADVNVNCRLGVGGCRPDNLGTI